MLLQIFAVVFVFGVGTSAVPVDVESEFPVEVNHFDTEIHNLPCRCSMSDLHCLCCFNGTTRYFSSANCMTVVLEKVSSGTKVRTNDMEETNGQEEIQLKSLKNNVLLLCAPPESYVNVCLTFSYDIERGTFCLDGGLYLGSNNVRPVPLGCLEHPELAPFLNAIHLDSILAALLKNFPIKIKF